jgi:hypothetical protein
MRSMLVAGLLELLQCAEQVVVVPDEGAGEEFVAAGLHPPFRDLAIIDAICSRGPVAAEQAARSHLGSAIQAPRRERTYRTYLRFGQKPHR